MGAQVSSAAAVRVAIGLTTALLASSLTLAPTGAGARAPTTGHGAPAAQAAKKHRGKSLRRGTLILKIGGLPKHARSRVSVTGPRQARHARHRFHRRLRRVGKVKLHRLRAGKYVVKTKPVKIRRRSGAIERGATAQPVRGRRKVRVKPGKARAVNAAYGTIRNPGVRSLGEGRIAAVLGDPTNPAGLVVKGKPRPHKGTILSARPSPRLPRGLLAHVTAVTRNGAKTGVALSPAGIYEVAPNATFDVPLAPPRSKEARARLAKVECGGSASLKPFIHLSDFHLVGHWTTQHVLFFHVKTGAEFELHFRAGVGVDATSAGAVSCEIPFPPLAIEGMAGPIPVFGSINPALSAELGSKLTISTAGSTDVKLGAKVGGVPPGASPVVGFGSPRFDFSADLFAGMTASAALNAQLGIGVASAANLHAQLGNSLDFTAAPGNCSWDLDLGTFSAGGKLGPFEISTPSTPPAFHRNLWHRACGGNAPPPPTLPFARATMSWDTTSDVDLYTWDSAGEEAYYGNQFAIPGAELVEDVCVLTACEVPHSPEVFQEDASPNRTYTFGICDYDDSGGGANVTLTVADPGGGTRTFTRTLTGTGDNAVITTSPAVAGFDPGTGWCNTIAPASAAAARAAKK